MVTWHAEGGGGLQEGGGAYWGMGVTDPSPQFHDQYPTIPVCQNVRRVVGTNYNRYVMFL